MLKLWNCDNFEPINEFTRIYPSETSVGFLFNLYIDIPSIGCTQDILTWAWRMIYWRNLNDVKKVTSRKMEQKKNFRESLILRHPKQEKHNKLRHFIRIVNLYRDMWFCRSKLLARIHWLASHQARSSLNGTHPIIIESTGLWKNQESHWNGGTSTSLLSRLK
jgi:hypothetical protein